MIHTIPTEMVEPVLREEFQLSEDEISQTVVTYNDSQQTFTIDFGDVGIPKTPSRAERLMQMLGLNP
jgi:hypothetical protein